MRAKLSANSEIMMILALFGAFRLMSLILTTSSSLMTAGHTDFMYYYEMARLSDQGYLPFINFWFEYPPVFTYMAIGAYQLASLAHGDISYFSQILGLILLPFEFLGLVSLYLIADHLYDKVTAVRLSWVYSALYLPMFFWRYSFDTMVAGLTLLAIYLLLAERRGLSAIALGIAVGTKLTPAFLLGTVWRFASRVRRALGYTAVVLLVLVFVFGYFVERSPTFTFASFESLGAVSSWETVWALVDGNYAYGDVGNLARHFDPAQAPIPLHNPPVVPSWLTLAAAAGLFLFLYSRPVDRTSPRQLMLFSGITLMIFHLWSKGWSPQWITLVLPFLLLLYPNWRGVLLALTLSFASLLDWPMAFAYQNNTLFVAGILLRTGLFVLILVDLWGELEKSLSQSRSKQTLVSASLLH